MTYNEFIQWALAQPASVLNYDNNKNGTQCVSLIKWYIKKVREITPQSIGNANQYWYKRNGSYIKKVLANGGQIIAVGKGNKAKPKAGDIVVMMKDGNATGHICIANGNNSSSYFKSYDTNWGSHTCNLRTHRYDSEWYVLGLLRMSSIYTFEELLPPDEEDDGSSSDEGHTTPEINKDADLAILKILNII